MERIAAAIVAKLRAVFVLKLSKNTHLTVLNDASSFAPSRFVRLWIPNASLSQCRATWPPLKGFCATAAPFVSIKLPPTHPEPPLD